MEKFNNNNIENYTNNNIENNNNFENNNEKNEAAPPQNFFNFNNTTNNEKYNETINNEYYNNKKNISNNNNEYYITPENNIEDETNIIRCINCKQIPLINITNTCKNLFINFSCLCKNNKNDYFNINDFNKYIQFNSLNKIICSNFNEHENDKNNKYASFYCFDHKTFYCSNCIKNHNIFCKEHKLIPLKNLDSNCMNHPENKFIGYCKSCCINFCEKCKHDNNDNIKHKIILYKDIFISGDELEKYRENILKIKDSINKLEDIKNKIIFNYQEYMKKLEYNFQLFKEKYLNLYYLLENIIKSYEIMTYDSKIIINNNKSFHSINYNLIMNVRNNFNDFNFPNINDINITNNNDLYSLNINYGKLIYIFKNFCYKTIKKKGNNEKEDLNFIEEIKTIKICKNFINTIIELHNGYIALCSSDDCINIFNNNNFEKVININNFIGGVWDICETYNYKILASYGNEQAHIKIFNIDYNNNTYYNEYMLEFHLGYILKILQLSYKNYICYCSCDYTINFYEINNDNNNNNYIKKFYLTELSSVISILEIKFKNILISVNSNGQLSSYDIINRKKINMIDDIYCNEKNCLIQFNFDEILIGCYNEIKIINVDNFNILSNILYNKQNLNCVINININKILVGYNNDNNNDLKTNFKSGIELKNKGLIILGTFEGNIKIYKYINN